MGESDGTSGGVRKSYRPARAAFSHFVARSIASFGATTAEFCERRRDFFFGGFADWRFGANKHVWLDVTHLDRDACRSDCRSNGESQTEVRAMHQAIHLSRTASRQHPPSLDGRVVSWSRQDSRARDRLVETGERSARAFALDVFPRTRALNPPPSRRRGFAFDASRPPSCLSPGSSPTTVQAPRSRRRRDMGASSRRARAALAVVAFLAIFPRVAFAKPADLEDPDLCDVDNGARLPRPDRLPAQNPTPRVTPRRTRSPRPHTVAPPDVPSWRARFPRASPPRVAPPLSLSRPSSLLLRVPPYSSSLSAHGVPSSRASPSDPAPQSGTARRRTDSSARTTYRRRARLRRSTAT